MAIMKFLSWFKKKPKKSVVEGVFSYIPGSQTPNQDETIAVERGELVKRLYVQPEIKDGTLVSNIRIYTGNPFRWVVR